MNLTLWTAIREYVQAEVMLAMQRHRLYHMADRQHPILAPEIAAEIKLLEEQVSRMETSVRDLLAEGVAETKTDSAPPVQEGSK